MRRSFRAICYTVFKNLEFVFQLSISLMCLRWRQVLTTHVGPQVIVSMDGPGQWRNGLSIASKGFSQPQFSF